MPLLFAVLEAKGANPYAWNTVAIVGLDGYARAKTTFTPMPIPAAGCMGAILPPSAHVAAGKVFFADAKGVVRSLAINGTVTTVTTFPLTSTQQMLSFAVSPDGARVLGTVFTTPKNAFSCDGSTTTAAFSFDAYSAVSGQASQLVYHQSWTKPPSSVMALTGWDAIGPIGTYPTVWASQGGGPGSTLGVFVRIDAATIKPLAPLADPSKCPAWDTAASGDFVCIEDPVVNSAGMYDQTVSIRRVDDSEVWKFTVTTDDGAVYSASLAPDEQHVVLGAGYVTEVAGRDGSRVKLGSQVLGQQFWESGWLNSSTLIGGDSKTFGYVRLSAPGTVVPLGFTGLFLGTVQGG
ncbi:MAG TPA: hypothetical protein VGK42_02815 [Candidatus Dormibacteraeota bacterium]